MGYASAMWVSFGEALTAVAGGSPGFSSWPFRSKVRRWRPR